MSRTDALAAYEKLPLPDTTEEHWRFTDLRGFDPNAFEGAASAEIETLLDLDVAGYATVTAVGIEIEKTPDGISFEPLTDDCESDFAFKGALRDEATAVWRGMIRVEKDAQKTNAYQECRNLMLSPTTHAVPIPGLEILANDVRCTHGATVGRVNREDLFYLQSRGLPRHEAERLIVRGFFQEILDRIELEPVREAVTAALEARIPQA